MTTTTTSGAAIQPVLWVSPEQFANFMDADEAQFGRYVPARKTSAGNFTMPLFAAPAQPAAQQGAAYAALPEKYYLAGGEVPTWDATQMHAFADATHALRASHGQAPSQAGEYPALVCDYCGALTPDPWHSSGMLHGKMSKHIHSCDACAARGAAQAQAAKQQEQLI